MENLSGGLRRSGAGSLIGNDIPVLADGKDVAVTVADFRDDMGSVAGASVGENREGGVQLLGDPSNVPRNEVGSCWTLPVKPTCLAMPVTWLMPA